MNYSWVRKRRRKRVPDENPESRRVNALAALVTGRPPVAYWVAKPGGLRAGHLLALVRAATPGLWARGVYLHFLPPYNPELNAIEPVFRAVKHHGLPQRRYTTVPALLDAVHAAFEKHRIAKSVHHPRRAA